VSESCGQQKEGGRVARLMRISILFRSKTSCRKTDAREILSKNTNMKRDEERKSEERVPRCDVRCMEDDEARNFEEKDFKREEKEENRETELACKSDPRTMRNASSAERECDQILIMKEKKSYRGRRNERKHRN
jgi:hypothetical protein